MLTHQNRTGWRSFQHLPVPHLNCLKKVNDALCALFPLLSPFTWAEHVPSSILAYSSSHKWDKLCKCKKNKTEVMKNSSNFAMSSQWAFFKSTAILPGLQGRKEDINCVILQIICAFLGNRIILGSILLKASKHSVNARHQFDCLCITPEKLQTSKVIILQHLALNKYIYTATGRVSTEYHSLL